MAGDLTIHGKRDAIFVIREEKGKRVTHWVDIRSKDMFNSPVYYLKQNDVVYVQPNKVRAGQSTINENSVKSVSFGLASVRSCLRWRIALQVRTIRERKHSFIISIIVLRK